MLVIESRFVLCLLATLSPPGTFNVLPVERYKSEEIISIRFPCSENTEAEKLKLHRTMHFAVELDILDICSLLNWMRSRMMIAFKCEASYAKRRSLQNRARTSPVPAMGDKPVNYNLGRAEIKPTPLLNYRSKLVFPSL